MLARQLPFLGGAMTVVEPLPFMDTECCRIVSAPSAYEGRL